MTTVADQVVEALGERGLTAATTKQIAGFLDTPADHVRQRLGPMIRRGELVSPGRGMWVLVPTEFRSWGAPDGIDLIDPWMAMAGRDYYVSWMTAAMYHGAANQSPMVFQVAVSDYLKDRVVGRNRIRFHTKNIQGADRIWKSSPVNAGWWMATPEQTAVDCASDLTAANGISNAVTIIADLDLERGLDPDRLAVLASQHHPVTARRIGWALDTYGESGIDLTPLLRLSSEHPTASRLVPDEPRRGPHDQKWNLVLNTEVFPDL